MGNIETLLTTSINIGNIIFRLVTVVNYIYGCNKNNNYTLSLTMEWITILIMNSTLGEAYRVLR